jgi:peptidoglycan/LPS O-acetylase OafA/YrhL
MTVGEGLRREGNSLNAIRLVLALMVLVSHSWPLSGRGADEPTYAGLHLGGWAVAGFFVISGCLIAGSRTRTDLHTFLIRRARRIFPGYWAVLVVTAFVLSPLAALVTGERYELGSAVRYVWANSTTYMGSWDIGRETLHVADPAFTMWNGSIWTLWYELSCYLIMGVLVSIRAVRARPLLTAGACLGIGTWFVLLQSGPYGSMAWFGTFFAAGWVVHCLRDRLPASGPLAVAAVFVAAGVAMVAPALTALPLSYAVLVAGVVVRTRRFAVNDISYGTYLYAYPAQQFLGILGFGRLPVGVFIATSAVLAVGAGAASWFLVERRFLHRRTPAHAKNAPTLEVRVGAF